MACPHLLGTLRDKLHSQPLSPGLPEAVLLICQRMEETGKANDLEIVNRDCLPQQEPENTSKVTQGHTQFGDSWQLGTPDGTTCI